MILGVSVVLACIFSFVSNFYLYGPSLFFLYVSDYKFINFIYLFKELALSFIDLCLYFIDFCSNLHYFFLSTNSGFCLLSLIVPLGVSLDYLFEIFLVFEAGLSHDRLPSGNVSLHLLQFGLFCFHFHLTPSIFFYSSFFQ